MLRAALKESIPHYLLWRTYQEKQDSFTQDTLVTKYMYLVEQMANRLSVSIPQRIISKDDLMGLGYIGLIEAIKKFDYKKGFQFETYGLWRIKGAMLDGVRKLDWVPRGLRDKAKKLNNAYRTLEQSLMRAPTEEELSQYLNISLDEVDQIMSVVSLSTLLSLDEPINANEDEGKLQSLVDQVKDDNSVNQERQVMMEEFKKIMAGCIEKMPEKEKLVVTLFYYEGLSQVEIAEVLDLTKGRISQIHSRAILRLRQSFEAKGYSLDSFFN